MTREYDLFERFPDGSSLWRACVSGLGNTRHQLEKLAQKSQNKFYAIDVTAGKVHYLRLERDAFAFRSPRRSEGRSNQRIA
jgi:hypothetical protein